MDFGSQQCCGQAKRLQETGSASPGTSQVSQPVAPSAVSNDNSGVQALVWIGLVLPHDGDRRILTMVTFGIQWSLMSEAPWQSIQVSVYVESQTGNTTGFLCGLITHGICLKWG